MENNFLIITFNSISALGDVNIIRVNNNGDIIENMNEIKENGMYLLSDNLTIEDNYIVIKTSRYVSVFVGDDEMVSCDNDKVKSLNDDYIIDSRYKIMYKDGNLVTEKINGFDKTLKEYKNTICSK